MKKIRIYQTHIEVSPYKQGESKELEKRLSKSININRYGRTPFIKVEPLGYFVYNGILYLPRGISESWISGLFNATPVVSSKPDDYKKFKYGTPLFEPKSIIQENAIKFLCGEEGYENSNRYSQLGLNLETGDGKTYATICAIMKLKLKSIIITHQTKIKNQWKESILNMTDFPSDRLIDIDNAGDLCDKIMNEEVEGDIYLVNHQSLQSYARRKGWDEVRNLFKKMKVGIKVIDESHKFFDNTFMIDSFSNCFKSIYLTATFGRSDRQEATIYKKAFSSLLRFGEEETLILENKRKHVQMAICYFKSIPEYGILPNITTNYGMSSYKYIDYEFSDRSGRELEKVLLKIIDKTKDIEGKTLILSPKTETVEYIRDIVSEYTGEKVGCVYSKNSHEENERSKREYKYISSTNKSVGEGADIKGLRIMINLELVGGKILANQMEGRLREYAPDKDTFLFYPVDVIIPECMNALGKIMPVMKKKCKEISVIQM